jgi:hypothetical protein
MFETEPNLWLQSFASPWLTALMERSGHAGIAGRFHGIRGHATRLTASPLFQQGLRATSSVLVRWSRGLF